VQEVESRINALADECQNL
jgi:DNA replication initiation complex subunit (GINS family)